MELELGLYMDLEAVIGVFLAIVLIVYIVVAGKIEQNKPITKEVKKDDNRRNKKRSSKTNVHKSR
jgi:hypothetical protein